MDKLQAINTILDEIGTGHVNNEDARHPDARSAKLQLDIEIRTLLQRGWWFNTLPEVTVPVQANGSLLLGTNVLKATPVDKLYAEQYVKRGRYMWDLVNNTGKFDAPLDCIQYVELPWDELPHNARMVVLYAAAAAVVRQKLSDTVKERELSLASAGFYAELESEEMRTARMSSHQNKQVASFRAKLRRRS